MTKRTHEDFETTAPAVNEYCLLVIVSPKAWFLSLAKLVIPEGNCNSSSNVWQKLIGPSEIRHVS
jgi:hypothetical protein